MREQAFKEEQEGQQKEQILLNYMQPHSQKMDEMRRELQNPEEFQPNEKFDYKYALIVGNQTYNKKYITLDSLPAVADDLKNAKHTVKMMNIPQENTFVL